METLPTPLDPDKKEQTKQDKLIRYLFTEPDTKSAALKAGYAKSSADTIVYSLIKTPTFQSKLRQYAINHDLMDMPQLARIEQKCLNIVSSNPEKYPKFKEIFAQKKRIAGILAAEPNEERPVIRIGTIERMQVIIGKDIG